MCCDQAGKHRSGGGGLTTGTLYLVATPIGHLGDITVRALDTLKSVDIVASEDTRHTGRLLRHYGIEAKQVAFHEHNEDRVGPRIMAMLASGRSVAVATSAGTPGICDPGFTLVRAAARAGHPVTMIPGASAVIMAVVLSGLPVHAFAFRGFPPRKPGQRKRFLEADKASVATLVYYESPHRISKLLVDSFAVFGDRPAALANDLTKLYERVTRGRLSDLSAVIAAFGEKVRGEYCLVVGGADIAADYFDGWADTDGSMDVDTYAQVYAQERSVFDPEPDDTDESDFPT